MKTAISIPDSIFQAAEDLADRLGMSRSELFSKAVKQFVEQHTAENLTERINQVCRKVETSLDPALERMQEDSLPRDAW